MVLIILNVLFTGFSLVRFLNTKKYKRSQQHPFCCCSGLKSIKIDSCDSRFDDYYHSLWSVPCFGNQHKPAKNRDHSVGPSWVFGVFCFTHNQTITENNEGFQKLAVTFMLVSIGTEFDEIGQTRVAGPRSQEIKLDTCYFQNQLINDVHIPFCSNLNWICCCSFQL